uniref:EGF-like domain-containing protein n=1 Tax=Hippocampus comes TaxID=109280 RepID=A0A3Q2XZ03_HIPCM
MSASPILAKTVVHAWTGITGTLARASLDSEVAFIGNVILTLLQNVLLLLLLDFLGVCRPTPDYSSYSCRCPAGWQDPCLNGGSCVDNVGGFACECRPGFQGGRCETEIDECASQPCWNGANCRDYVNSFVCECRAGFDGFLCEHNIQECTESSCLNNGTCIDDINTFSCRCRPGFYGTFCEYEQNECDSQPCKNGGTCADGLGTYRCTCPVGYNGQNCQARAMFDHLTRETRVETFIQLFTHLFTVLFLELCQLVQPRALSQRGLLLADRNLLDLSLSNGMDRTLL